MKKVNSGEGATDLGSVEKQYEPPLDYQKQEVLSPLNVFGPIIPVPPNVHMYRDDDVVTRESGPVPAAPPDFNSGYRDGYEVLHCVGSTSQTDILPDGPTLPLESLRHGFEKALPTEHGSIYAIHSPLTSDQIVDIIYANWVSTAGHTFNNIFPRWIQRAADVILERIQNP